jgi:predicted transcriptional regulator
MRTDREPGEPLNFSYIPSASVEPLHSPTASDTIEDARTLMELHNVSQLPVLRGPRAVGVVTWESLGRALFRGPDVSLKDCTVTDFPKASIDSALLDYVDEIQ